MMGLQFGTFILKNSIIIPKVVKGGDLAENDLNPQVFPP